MKHILVTYATMAGATAEVAEVIAEELAGRGLAIGVFGGRLEYGRLPWWGVLLAMVILRVPAGERRNWEAIRQWARRLPEMMAGGETEAEPA